jgi:hypothetical protein
MFDDDQLQDSAPMDVIDERIDDFDENVDAD